MPQQQTHRRSSRLSRAQREALIREVEAARSRGSDSVHVIDLQSNNPGCVPVRKEQPARLGTQ